MHRPIQLKQKENIEFASKLLNEIKALIQSRSRELQLPKLLIRKDRVQDGYLTEKILKLANKNKHLKKTPNKSPLDKMNSEMVGLIQKSLKICGRKTSLKSNLTYNIEYTRSKPKPIQTGKHSDIEIDTKTRNPRVIIDLTKLIPEV